jgi:glycosyltransferase involved in cell wall biosynthesis
MSHLYIVEQSALAPGGHYHAYTGCVARAAREAGLDVTLLYNRRFRGDWNLDGVQLIPAFTHTWGEAEMLWVRDWTPGNLAYEIVDATRRRPPGRGDHVLVHTMGYAELRQLLEYLVELPVTPDLPFYHLLMRYDADVMQASLGTYRGLFDRIAASPLLREKIIFHTDTQQLSHDFSSLTGVEFNTLPIPFAQEGLLERLAKRGPRGAGEALNVIYLGDARLEKNYAAFPAAVRHLWKDYVEPGRARFSLQSNTNVPGGEPGILQAQQQLGQYPPRYVRLLTEPLSNADYYDLLADSDLVVIPYDAARYRARSSGVLIEAMAAGKPVVTTAGSWMDSMVDASHAVVCADSEGVGVAIAHIIDNYDAYRAGAEAIQPGVQQRATGLHFINALLASAEAHRRPASTAPLILVVMDGDAMVLRNGAARVAESQFKYLQQAGYRVCGLFTTNNRAENAADFERWTNQLRARIQTFDIERAFIAGPGRLSFDTLRQRMMRDRHEFSIQKDLDAVSQFEISAELIEYLRGQTVEAVLLTVITGYPLVSKLGLGDIPVICETLDIQSFQKAIYGGRPIDAKDLDDEFALLEKCQHLISLNDVETIYIRDRLPQAKVTTTGIFPPVAPSAIDMLAGPKGLGEVISSCGPALTAYQWEEAWKSDPAEVIRLTGLSSLDLLFVSSNHTANVSGLKWFLDSVYMPYLAPAGVSMAVAGSICEVANWPPHERLFFLGRLDALEPLYAAAKVVVLPIIEGAGGPVKTFEALSFGKPIVATSMALRGLSGKINGVMLANTADEFSSAVLDLLGSQEQRYKLGRQARTTADRISDPDRYRDLMNALFADVLGERALDAAAPPKLDRADPQVREWTDVVRLVNRLVRDWLENQPLEADTLGVLGAAPAKLTDDTIERVVESLILDGHAPMLKRDLNVLRAVAAPNVKAQARNLPRFLRAGFRYVTSASGLVDVSKTPKFDLAIFPRADANLAVVAAGPKVGKSMSLDGAPLSLKADKRADDIVIARTVRSATTQPGGYDLELVSVALGAGASAFVLSQPLPLRPGATLWKEPLFQQGGRVWSQGPLVGDQPIDVRLPLPFATESGACFLDVRIANKTGAVVLRIGGEEVESLRYAPNAEGVTYRFRLNERLMSRGDIWAAGALTASGGAVSITGVTVHFVMAEDALATLGLVTGLVDGVRSTGQVADTTNIGSLLSTIRAGKAMARDRAAFLARQVEMAGDDTTPVAWRDGVDGAPLSRRTLDLGMPLLRPSIAIRDAREDRDLLAFVASSSLSWTIEAVFTDPEAAERAVCSIDERPAQSLEAEDGLSREWCLPGSQPGRRSLLQRIGEKTGLWASSAVSKVKKGVWLHTLVIDDPKGSAAPRGVWLKLRLPALSDVRSGAEPLLVDNIHGREMFNPAAGQVWTGPDPTTRVSLPLALTGPGVLTIHVSNFGDLREAGELNVVLNSRALPCVLEREGHGGGKVTANFDADEEGVGILELKLTTRRMYNAPGDPRRLGLAIASVDLRFAL